MKKSIFSFRNEDGSTLIIAVLILLLGTLIGIFAINTSTIEIQIAGNDKSHKMAFYRADSGIYTIPKVISKATDDKATPGDLINYTYGAFTYSDNGTNDDGSSGPTFYRKLAGFDANSTGIKFALGGNDVEVYVERLRVINMVGGGAEFAAASEGAGVGGLRGIFYGLDSVCAGLQNSRSNIGAQYLKVTSAAGGM